MKHQISSIRQGTAWLFIFFLLLTSCSSTNQPDTSAIKIDLHTYRFDLDLYKIDTNNVAKGLQQLHAKYPDFLNYYLDTLMAYRINGNYSDSAIGVREGLRTDLTEKGHIGLEDTIKKYFPDNKDIDKALTDGFKLMKYYIPSYDVPKIIYLNMGLSNWPSFMVDQYTFCIGLDMFLGEQYPYYRSIGVPDYMAAHMRKSYIPVSVFSAIYYTFCPFYADNRNLLDLMIQRGKCQYFLHKVLPAKPDTILFGFTDIQVNWCNENEAVIYNYFIKQNLLFNSDPSNARPYVYDGPFAKGLEPVTNAVKSTPGNIGSWLGYKIVSSYMAQHPKTTLKQLLDMKYDPAKFLDEANYRPK